MKTRIRINDKKEKPSVEEYCKDVISNNRNMLVPWYLILSFLYYKKDIGLVPDSLFDKICLRLRKEWKQIEHQHKYLIDRKELRAGTGYYIKDYPGMVKGAALRLYNKGPNLLSHKKLKITKDILKRKRMRNRTRKKRVRISDV